MEKSFGSRHAVKSKNLSQSVSIARRVMNAIRKLQGNKGISLHDLKKYLSHEKNIDIVVYNADINLALKSAVDKGLLVRESGNYKARETKGRRRSRSKGGRRKRSSGKKRSRSRRKRSGSRRKRSGSRPKRSGSRRRRSRRRKAAAEEGA